jgi:hypothetical protein
MPVLPKRDHYPEAAARGRRRACARTLAGQHAFVALRLGSTASCAAAASPFQRSATCEFRIVRSPCRGTATAAAATVSGWCATGRRQLRARR